MPPPPRLAAKKAFLEFAKKGGLLVSKNPLPEGEGYQVVVQVKATPDAKSKNFRIPLVLHTCKGCNNRTRMKMITNIDSTGALRDGFCIHGLEFK